MDDAYKIQNTKKLDGILVKLCDLIAEGQRRDSKKYGLVAACVVDNDDRRIYRLNYLASNGKRIHAERAAIAAYETRYGDIPKGSIIVTTLSPCCDHMSDRFGSSCTDMINRSNVHKVYCGYLDPTQTHCAPQFTLKETKKASLRKLCKAIADSFL